MRFECSIGRYNKYSGIKVNLKSKDQGLLRLKMTNYNNFSQQQEKKVSWNTSPIVFSTTPEPQSGAYIVDLHFGTYIIILFAATLLVLIWAFLLMCYFSGGKRRTIVHGMRSGRSSWSSTSTSLSLKSDSPPQYDAAINSITFPTLVLDPKLLEEAPPMYQDVVIVKHR